MRIPRSYRGWKIARLSAYEWIGVKPNEPTISGPTLSGLIEKITRYLMRRNK